MYAKIQNGSVVEYPYGFGQLQKDNPNTSFALPITAEVYAEHGVYPVTNTEQPVVNHTKRVIAGTPSLVNGAWVQTWVVQDVPTEELQQLTTSQAHAVRQLRDEKLKETDWRFRSDLTPSQDWKNYCQALRDVTAQSGFPWEVTWPTKPE